MALARLVQSHSCSPTIPLCSRFHCAPLPQDRFIRSHLTERDYLIVSVGGNDLALAPVLATILNIVPLLCCTPQVRARAGMGRGTSVGARAG